MKLLILSLLVVGVAGGSSAFGMDRRINCSANGKTVSENGTAVLSAAADFTFVETWESAGRTLVNIYGSFQVYSDMAESNYIGNFKIPLITENAKYRPIKYKGYSQFPKFNATDTSGSAEDGMWGQFLLEKNTNKARFGAHYIFQAGDHMGGTLHMTCSYAK
jgi:hypothetical protein